MWLLRLLLLLLLLVMLLLLLLGCWGWANELRRLHMIAGTSASATDATAGLRCGPLVLAGRCRRRRRHLMRQKPWTVGGGGGSGCRVRGGDDRRREASMVTNHSRLSRARMLQIDCRLDDESFTPNSSLKWAIIHSNIRFGVEMLIIDCREENARRFQVRKTLMRNVKKKLESFVLFAEQQSSCSIRYYEFR
uniref:Uncharacterized protein n=1 Tax=Anopheles maculatus TaxID=74869 RepID=A0A182SVG7_9DIPT